MKRTIKSAICGLALIVSLGFGIIAEAGRIPSHMVPLQTYATKAVYTYDQIGARWVGWIDEGDYVIVNQIRSDGWARGSYPGKNGRVTRWFKIDDLLYNPSFRTLDRMAPAYRVKVYKNYAYNGDIGWIENNEDIWVVSNLGDVWQIVYKVNSGGYKMGWVPYWDCLQKPVSRPVVQPVTRPQTVTTTTATSSQLPAASSVQVVNTNRQAVTVDTLNGINAVYPGYNKYPRGAFNSDTTYSCAAFVKRYYTKIRGFDVDKLNIGLTPRNVSTGKYFTRITDGTVQVGDIIGVKSSRGENGHWAIAKGKDGDQVVLIEQNWWYSDTQKTVTKNRRLKIKDVNVYRWNG